MCLLKKDKIDVHFFDMNIKNALRWYKINAHFSQVKVRCKQGLIKYLSLLCRIYLKENVQVWESSRGASIENHFGRFLHLTQTARKDPPINTGYVTHILNV